MKDSLVIYNTVNRNKEKFEPLHDPLVAMHVCGPTVYSDVHLGTCLTFVPIGLTFHYFRHPGYHVRYVRHIADAGHLEGDGDEGDNNVFKKARLEKVEPIEIGQRHTLGFH